MHTAERPLNPGTIRVNVNRVLINVSVLDTYGNPVAGLEKKDFRLYEDNEEQEILTATREDVPASIGLLVDTSQSMTPRMDAARAAVTNFLKKSNTADEFFLVDFNNHALIDSYFTSDINLLQQRALPLKPNGKTALLDAIYTGLALMKGAHNDRHVLLIFSDGGDNHSRRHEGEIRGLLQEADSEVFALGIFNKPELIKTDEERQGPALLTELTGLTGGSLYTVQDPNDLAEFAAKISNELRSEYVISFKPLRQGADYRHIKVTVMAPDSKQLKIHARSGYYGPH